MINQSIIQELMLSPLMVDDKYLQVMAMSAFAAFQHKTTLSSSKYEAVYAVNAKTGAKQTTNYTEGSVGMVVIDGPIVSASDPWYGIKGTIEAAQELQLLFADPNIVSVVLYLETGGGAVYALKPIIDVLEARNKPVVTFTKQILASAGYRIAASTDHIMMYHPQGIVGSLGTMFSSSDMQPMFEKWGMKFFEYYASDSTLKNKTYTDAKNGDGKALIKNVLNPMNELFISDIKSLRGDIISSTDKTVYQGETYLADPQGLALGLIDSVGSLADAVTFSVQLAEGSATPSTSQSFKNSNMSLFSKKVALSSAYALKGVLAKDVTPAQVQAVNEELEAEGIPGITAIADTDLESLLAENTRLKAEAKTHGTAGTELATAKARITELETAQTTAKTAADGALATMTTDRDAWKAKAVEYGAKSADTSTGGEVVEETIQGTEAPVSSTFTEADAEMAALRSRLGIKSKVKS